MNQVVYWSRPLDWHNQLLTPNPDSIYILAFFNTKDVGPVVLDIPAAGDEGSLNANIVDIWQVPLEDAGPSGADAGKGGKYLLLPPEYKEPVPQGYIVLRPATFTTYALLRSNLKAMASPTWPNRSPTPRKSRSIRSRKQRRRSLPSLRTRLT